MIRIGETNYLLTIFFTRNYSLKNFDRHSVLLKRLLLIAPKKMKNEKNAMKQCVVSHKRNIISFSGAIIITELGIHS